MSRNDAEDFAQRLYARLPAHYRVYDRDGGQPLLALLRVVGGQVANVRADLDALWDNFFIETCDDWAVPYIGALLGTKLLQQQVGQSNRLDVWNTVLWRRSKGTPDMLQALSQAISGLPADLAEFFESLGWSQNLNHVRLSRALTPDLRDPFTLSLLGRAADTISHAADFKPARALDQSPVTPAAGGIGRAAWATPGRYQIKNLGVFVRRLQTFAVKGATPAGAAPGLPLASGTMCFAFDPLFRPVPLFALDSSAPITRAAFQANPWDRFGGAGDIAVRQHGVLLATEAAPVVPELQSSQKPYSFGGATAGIGLDASVGLRLMQPRTFALGSAHFVITANWQQATTSVRLGALSTLLAAAGSASAYQPGATATGAGQLQIVLRLGHPGADWAGPALPSSPPARFPGAVVALRAARPAAEPQHASDGIYVYLPPTFLASAATATYFVADDGSTYTSTELDLATLARVSEGPVYPAREIAPSSDPAQEFLALNRKSSGLTLLDPARFGSSAVLIEAMLLTGPGNFQRLGAIATAAVSAPATQLPGLSAPTPWPAFTYAPSTNALSGNLPAQGLLGIRVSSLSGVIAPPSELIVTNRRGAALLVYLPEIDSIPAGGVQLLVAADGSTYLAPADAATQQSLLTQGKLTGLTLARAGLGQVLPLAGVWPLQQRTPVAINLCRNERSALLVPGELGVDPELGRFALPSQDTALPRGGFSVDFVEAFGASIGAVNADTGNDATALATRLVAQSGDADRALAANLSNAPLHSNLADAIAAARDGDVIEIVDSATYAAPSGIALANAAVRTLTIRAGAASRPCLTFYAADGQPSAASFTVQTPMDTWTLSGLLASGGPILIQRPVKQFAASACSFDPRSAKTASLIASDADLNTDATYRFTRCITGGLLVGLGVGQLMAADSIVDQRQGVAIGAATAGAIRSVQLERVTVIGRIVCDVLTASDSLLNDIATVADQQSGCVRFTRFERGSVLPRRFQCIPSDTQPCPAQGRCVAPMFHSLRYGRPDYAQLAAGCPEQILTASEQGAEVGAFAGGQNTVRLKNLRLKLQEFMPVGLSAMVVAET